MDDQIVLVDKNDKTIGFKEKLKGHLDGDLHRALSIFVFDSADNLLIQKRALTKYHSGSLWSNTCCSHPRPGETIEDAAHRRLREEMGFDCILKEVFSFVYRVEVNNNLTEHEYDHVLIGRFDGEPNPDANEVDEWKWIQIEELKSGIEKNPGYYTAWLVISLDRVLAAMTASEGSYAPPA